MYSLGIISEAYPLDDGMWRDDEESCDDDDGENGEYIDDDWE